MSRSHRIALTVGSLLALGACEGAIPVATDPEPTVVVTELPADARAERDALLAEVEALGDLTPGELLARHPVAHETLPYDPLAAVNLDLVQGSALALDDRERERLGRDGFVVTDRTRFPSFAYGYQTIYLEDLPVYISADAILEAMHRGYDQILQAAEARSLAPSLDSLLASMREALAGAAGASLEPQVRADLDLYLDVAHSLLRGEVLPCAAGCSDAQVADLVAAATAHEGAASVSLFGVMRLEDFSQFEPRGHYAGDPGLERYFRAMMWLGRVDFRLLETLPDHSQVFHRRQLLAALGLRTVMDAAALARWNEIDTVITAFVGEHDAMILPELDVLLATLGVSGAAELASIDDATVAQAIVDEGLGRQRISSHIMINGLGQGTMPLSAAFAFFGQRYVVDSHVFSNVVYDRVQHGAVRRMMPSTLDVAYAALGNDQALAPLAGELGGFGYAPDLEAMRTLVDAHGADYWEQDLYTGWLGALRALSRHDDPGLPAVARTEAWGRRILSTQLASWSELRHDTVLYAKQSYTTGAACEFPDGYVEPYPELFQRIAAWARIGGHAVQLTGADSAETAYFARVEQVATTLADMAASQRSGTPFTAEQLAFLNDAVVLGEGCDLTPYLRDGWYAELSYDRERAVRFDPTIADVHTQPTDEVGNRVGRVLHVGTGQPRLAVFTFETCEGPRAYVGLVSSYFEQVTQDYERRTDDEWAASLNASGHPADPAFLGDLVIR